MAQSTKKMSWSGQVWGVTRLGLVVIITCGICWCPYLGSLHAAQQVVQRILPVQRGIYEDYVANFWCSTHFAVHWKQLLSQQALLRLCMGGEPPHSTASSPACALEPDIDHATGEVLSRNAASRCNCAGLCTSSVSTDRAARSEGEARFACAFSITY